MMSTVEKTPFDLGEKIRISPSIWPGRELEVQPGDLSRFAPYGNGVYGYQNHGGANPFMDAPKQDACGGVIYFENDIARSDLDVLIHVLGIQSGSHTIPTRDFAVFIAESEKPGEDGYLAQIRVVSRFGLRFIFEALTETEYEKFLEQELSIADVLWTFIQCECERWGTYFGEDAQKGLRGLFGGDGNYAREELSFGLMVENSDDICRIWSRAWLVTK